MKNMDQIRNHPLYGIHSIDSVMSSLWEFYKKKFLVLFFLSLVMSLIIQFASTLINFRELQSITDPQELLIKVREYIWPMILISILNLLFSTILHYYIIFNPLDSENNIFRCLIKSLRYFIPYLIIIILLAFFGSIALLLGLVVLIIGVFFAALYIMTIYLFILPVMMIEGPNIANTISRTISLTHKNFWPNLGWTAVMILILLVISVILSGLILLPFTGSFMKVFANPEDPTALLDVASNPIYLILTSIVNAMVFPLLPVFACILYFNGCAREDQASLTNDLSEKDPNEKVKVEDLYAKPLPEDPSDEPDSR